MRLLILADDFTGALDTAVQLAKQAIQTVVLLRPGQPGGMPVAECEVLCVNTATRHLSPAQAHRVTSQCLAAFPGAACVYLKTDSALRGNLSATFHAARAALRRPVYFAPAYPKAGRTTTGGRQYVGGVPLEESAFANDPLNPMRTGVVADILSADYPLTCLPHPAGQPLQDLTAPADVHLFDAETDAQLDTIGQTLAGQDLLGLAAGCAGFAEVLPRHLPFGHTPAGWAPNPGPVLFLSGSANQATFEQLAHATAAGLPVLTIPAALKLAAPEENAALLDALYQALAGHLGAGHSAVLATAQSPDELTTPAGGDAFHRNIERVFTTLAERLWARQLFGSLAVFGGDTAQAVLDTLGAATLRPVLEVQPGVPLSVAGAARPLNLVTKSGGLGQPDAVAAINACLRHGQPQR